jgi:hypothetical protein
MFQLSLAFSDVKIVPCVGRMPCRRISASKNWVTFRVTQRKLKQTQFSILDISSSSEHKGVQRVAPLLMNSIFLHLHCYRCGSFAACAKRDYTGAMRTAWKKIRYRLEWLGLTFATKFVPLLSRKACYGLAFWSARSAHRSIVGAGALC